MYTYISHLTSLISPPYLVGNWGICDRLLNDMSQDMTPGATVTLSESSEASVWIGDRQGVKYLMTSG